MNSTFEFSTNDARTGFRLNKLEAYNWGTFNEKVYSISPEGFNALLTGDIGSGKSTLVDALTTLIVPHHKIIYNKAAGAESRNERNLYTYIRGEHTNKKDEDTGASKAVYLRDEDKYTVLLAYFYNEGYEQHITLAQVFWLKNNKIEKFFVISGQKLGIKEHFSDFDGEISKLKKRLKNQNTIEVYDSFNQYSDRFRQTFGIRQPEALDLFYQTVSMKSVGNLTDFVRNQMLGKTDVKSKIEDLVISFAKLTEAHNSVLKAKRQQDILNPLTDDIIQFENLDEKQISHKEILTDVPKYFASEKVVLLKVELNNLKNDFTAFKNQSSELLKELNKSREDHRELKNRIDKSEIAGQLRKMQEDLLKLEEDIEFQTKAYKEYESLCNDLNLSSEIDQQIFYGNRKKLELLDAEIDSHVANLTNKRDNLIIQKGKFDQKLSEIRSELISLKARKTKIPERSLNARNKIAEDLEIDTDEIPFVGELIKVREDELEWEGAIERRLHDFGLSILVPEEHYKRISNYINNTNLQTKIVYLRTVPHDKRNQIEIRENSLINKIEIKNDSSFYDWLERELEQKHNLSCCETIDEFQRELFAITKTGQIKTGRVKHEKDDRRDILDKRNYILGWSNIDKIKLLEKDEETTSQLLEKADKELGGIKEDQRKYTNKKNAIRDLSRIDNFEKINYKKSVIEKEQINKDYNTLKNSKGSEQYNLLIEQEQELSRIIEDKAKTLRKLDEEIGIIKNKLTTCAVQLFNSLKMVGAIDQIELSQVFKFDSEDDIFENLHHHIALWEGIKVDPTVISESNKTLISNYLVNYKIQLQTIEQIEKTIKDKIDAELDKIQRSLLSLSSKITGGMQKYKSEFPSEASDVDAKIEYKEDFKKLHKKIIDDDLPKFEDRFKKLLKEGTINELLIFKNNLERYEKEIKKKIDEINNHLEGIDYNTGTYIRIIEDKITTDDIKQFKIDLKNSTEGVFGESELYSEDKFIQVKKILDRFSSVKDEDKKWIEKVTDVRHWYSFGASERNREDQSEREYYSDSSGKSGGQKEKLAYTILASAIAYQFGLSWGESRSRSFRFVVIDEAFGRGSDESTRYGLRLFEKLNLQLLIVTPLQKINIIEDYINAVHFVSNPSGNRSMVRTLTKSAYLKEKEDFIKQTTSLND
jgi:uncharacterized protein YPO0396